MGGRKVLCACNTAGMITLRGYYSVLNIENWKRVSFLLCMWYRLYLLEAGTSRCDRVKPTYMQRASISSKTVSA